MGGIRQILGRLGVCSNLNREESVNLSDKGRADCCSPTPEASPVKMPPATATLAVCDLLWGWETSFPL